MLHSDTPAFETLYKTHYSSLCNTAHNITGDKDEAHDIVQEVFLKLWHRKEAIRTILHQKAYLFRAVINASLSHLENKKPLLSAGTIIGRAQPTEYRDAGSSLDQKELEARVTNALNSLPPKCRVIFALSRFEEMKYREIAEHLGLSLKTVENQMGIALKKMRTDLTPYLTREFIALAIGTGAAFLSRVLWLGTVFIFLLL